MYKELVFIKNNRDGWDYVLDIGKTENFPVYNESDIVDFLCKEFNYLIYDNIIINEAEVYILTDEQIPCVNCK